MGKIHDSIIVNLNTSGSLDKPDLSQIRYNFNVSKSEADNTVTIENKNDTIEQDKVLVKKPGRKKKSKMYFTKDTEDAIVEYNNISDMRLKNYIFAKRIKYPLEKLVENIINTFKFSYFIDSYVDVKAEVVSNLIINMNKYKPEKGRAFSYFSIIAKNYLIKVNNDNYEVMKVTYSIDSEDDNENNITFDILDPTFDNNEKRSDSREFIKLLAIYLKENIDKLFKKKRDKDIAESVVVLLNTIDTLEMFNKKALYLMMRDMTEYKTQNITKVLNKLEIPYKELKDKYYTNGHLDESEFF